jgi:hypothetical protein
MADVVFIAVAIGFFGLCIAYVRGLDRIVRGAEEADSIHEAAS